MYFPFHPLQLEHNTEWLFVMLNASRKCSTFFGRFTNQMTNPKICICVTLTKEKKLYSLAGSCQVSIYAAPSVTSSSNYLRVSFSLDVHVHRWRWQWSKGILLPIGSKTKYFRLKMNFKFLLWKKWIQLKFFTYTFTQDTDRQWFAFETDAKVNELNFKSKSSNNLIIFLKS